MHRTIFIGKAIKKLARLRGGGSALPGLFIERIDPGFMARILGQLPKGIVLVIGTNGKTTTTKIITELLVSEGLKVFTNRTGSNFTRGITSELLGVVNKSGKLDYDIAVLELDEAYAVHFVRQVAPTFTVVLNVMRDQLDRFGEIDNTTKLLNQVVNATTKGVVLNGDDERIASLKNVVGSNVDISFFGSSQSLHHLFLSDDDLHGHKKQAKSTAKFDVTLTDFNLDKATYKIDNKKFDTTLKLKGVYNFLNVAGALAAVKQILGKDFVPASIVSHLQKIEPAFGRGETLTINNQPLELILVKNPSGFRLALNSFDNTGWATMIAINDQYADGRDMSWLWDVDFSSLATTSVNVVSGTRAFDMALRLQYDDVAVGEVDVQLGSALKTFLNKNSDSPKRIYCTYTAMLALRQNLKRYTKVERIL